MKLEKTRFTDAELAGHDSRWIVTSARF